MRQGDREGVLDLPGIPMGNGSAQSTASAPWATIQIIDYTYDRHKAVTMNQDKGGLSD